MDADLDAVFSPREFGESVLLDGIPVKTGHFDIVDTEVHSGEGVSQIVAMPMFTCPTAYLPDYSDGSILVVRDINYTVKYWKDDGQGVTILYLESQPL